MSKLKHQPLRVPRGWTEQDRQLVIQLNNTLDDLYARIGEINDAPSDVRDVLYKSKKIVKLIGGEETDVVSASTLKTDMSLTSSDVGLGNVENKSSATIRSEITGQNVTDALGYTPFNAANVSDSLSDTSTTNALSAAKGKELDGKIPAVVNDLTSDSTTDALSAAQGKALNANKQDALTITDRTSSTAISNNANIPTNRTVLNAIYNNLDKSVAGFALDARQGKALNEKFRVVSSTSLTGTTSAYGYITTTIATSSKRILYAYGASVAYHIIPFVRSGKWEFYVTQVNNNGDCVAVKNTSVKVTYGYIDV